MGKLEGTVKWFNRDKGFGFISDSKTGEEYFVHHSALATGTFIRDNDVVSFDPVKGEKGMQAHNVTLIKKGSEVEKEE
ncbi:MAG: cold shock domain-containing protein [archaeon]